SMEVDKNPNYFVTDKPYLDKMFWVIVPLTGGQYLSAFQTAAVDIISLQPNDVGQMLNDKTAVVTTTFSPSVPYYRIILNNRNDPLKNPMVRQALYYATDRAAIFSTSYGSLGTIATGPIGN